MARYEKTDEGEGKFWEITLKGFVVSTRAGKIGAGASRDREGGLHLYDRRGRTTDRRFLDEASAQKQYDKLVAAKLKEGYRLASATAHVEAIEMHVNADLEAVILGAPNDIATYLVYADWLMAKGDSRGELITLQNAMRAQKDPASFVKFKKQEEALRVQHLASWLGPVAGKALHRLKLEWANGFASTARIDRPDNETEVSLAELVKATLASPILRFVRVVTLRGTTEELAAAIPDPPPPLLKRLNLRALDEPRTVLTRAKIDRAIEAYAALNITIDEDRYSPTANYVPARE